MQHEIEATRRGGYGGNASLRFESVLSKETYSRPIHYKAPHDINPQEHPRIINGAPYTVPLSRLEPYIDSVEANKKLEKNRRGRGNKMGWNFGNHRDRLHYFPTSGPFTPSNKAKYKAKRRRQQQNVNQNNKQFASLKSRTAKYTKKKLEMWKQERETRRVKDVVHNRRGSITQRFSNKEKEKKWSSDLHPARVATKKNFGGQIWDWGGGNGDSSKNLKFSSQRKQSIQSKPEVFLASNVALPLRNDPTSNRKCIHPASPRDLAEEFLQRANMLATEILERVDTIPDTKYTKESNIQLGADTYSPIKRHGKVRLEYNTLTDAYAHVDASVVDSKSTGHQRKGSVVEEGQKAIERLRMINAMEASNDVVSHELGAGRPEDELQELLNNNKPLKIFVKAIYDTSNQQLMQEILRLKNMNVKKMSMLDFISLLDCMQGVEYNVESLLLLLKTLVCHNDFHHVSMMKIIYFVENYRHKKIEDEAATRTRKLSNVRRRRQSWVEKYEKSKPLNENFVDAEIDDTANGRLLSGVQHSYFHHTSLRPSVPPPPPPPPPPPIPPPIQ